MYTDCDLNNFDSEDTMKLAVGQVVYLLDERKNSVLPAMVSEHVIKQTLSGDEELYFVEVAKSKKLLDLTSFDGKYFTTSSQVKDFLYSNLKKNIDRIIDKTEELALATWPDSVKPEEEPTPEIFETDVESDDSKVLVDLGDGRVARFKG